MKNIIRFLTSTQRGNLLAALLIGLLAFGLFVGSIHLTDLQPHYLNKTEQQARDDFDKAFAEMVQACRDAGGTWVAGLAQATCTVQFEMPKSEWYKAPITNPKWETLFWLSPVGIAISIILAVVFMLVLGMATVRRDPPVKK